MQVLDPHQERVFTTLTLAQPVMNGLIEFDPWDPGWKISPGLAERWEMNKEGTRIAFNLRKGVNWHDGKPFNSADAKFSLERAGANPPKVMVSPRSMAFQPIEKIETPDDHTVIVTLKYSYAEIMDLLAIGWNPSPHFFFSDWFVTEAGTNYYRVSDQRIDSMFAKQERTLDVEERKRTFWEMERILREDIVPGAFF